MTDLEIVKACAVAMGATRLVDCAVGVYAYKAATDGVMEFEEEWGYYNPLTDDAQAFALVTKFELDIHRREFDWAAIGRIMGMVGHGDTLNRAICLCVATMQAGGG